MPKYCSSLKFKHSHFSSKMNYVNEVIECKKIFKITSTNVDYYYFRYFSQEREMEGMQKTAFENLLILIKEN